MQLLTREIPILFPGIFSALLLSFHYAKHKIWNTLGNLFVSSYHNSRPVISSEKQAADGYIPGGAELRMP
jgi:hypothetical protein